MKRHNSWPYNKRGMLKRRKFKPLQYFINFLKNYCYHSSFHGLRYIVEPEKHWFERFIWALLFGISLLNSIIVIIQLSARFQAAETSTVVETTNYPVSKIPFPSVTLCPSNRVDWQKALSMEKKIVPPDDPEAIKTYRNIVNALSTITFGDFDNLNFLKNHSLEVFTGTLLDTNMTHFLRNIAPSCSELFRQCWWRSSDRNCCEIFEPQRTEYGFCYSFNSETADYDEETYFKERRPRRTNTMGDWNGVRFIIDVDSSIQPPDSAQAIGVTIFVDHPNAWPSNGRNSGVGKLASIAVQCPSTYATKSIFLLNEEKLSCKLGGGKYYNRDYCMTLCRRDYTILRCGCNPLFLLPSNNEARECNLDDLICLANENGFFNNYILQGNPYFPENDTGMYCLCPPECEEFNYSYQVTLTDLRKSIADDTIFVDVHFESESMMRYRMDIVYTKLDLIVSFGGIVGLFLGGSILSIAELLYFLTIGLISEIFRRTNKVEEMNKNYENTMRNNNRSKQQIPTVYKVLPLMDYYPNKRMRFHKY